MSLSDAYFDAEKLAKKLYHMAWEKRLSYRDIAAECSVSPSTITRIISDGKKPDVDTLARILLWLDADFRDFIIRKRP